MLVDFDMLHPHVRMEDSARASRQVWVAFLANDLPLSLILIYVDVLCVMFFDVPTRTNASSPGLRQRKSSVSGAGGRRSNRRSSAFAPSLDPSAVPEGLVGIFISFLFFCQAPICHECHA